MKIIKDQIGREITLKSVPKRIVSLVPSQTELLCDLALENELVGITKYCIHPFNLKSTKAIVGGTKKVDYEKIKELKPDFILCNKEENAYDMLPELEKIAPTYFSDVNTINDSIDLILHLGSILNRRTESDNLAHKIEFKLADFKQFIKDKPSRKVAYFIWANPWMVAGNDTYINEMLKLNKFENIYDSMSRYPKIVIDKIRWEGDPDVLIFSSEPYKFEDKHAMEIGSFTNRSITVFGDGEMFSWPGSRMLLAFDYFKELHKKLESHF
ncbi:ABC-type Fe3+-hydroxamate transport system, substrate-binding protein [Lutibacter oricola]|uniref:ABC-type Fe3+-hydroxamate transport system, substrate-binding protein n=1 Tax=Lutibacter oricola TaxID=762486 RepID=A0A1H3B3H6_9FLAO|nr:helical backbone metal receptor [Lutibacter oricola]SDX36570.1 ABC-type Fe3+-hydroxamate transport system, substrate-binding protein [Lutibacter oricola]